MLIITPDVEWAVQTAQACGHDADFLHCHDLEPSINSVREILSANDVRAVVVGPDLEPELSHALVLEISDSYPFLGVVLCAGKKSSEVRAAFRAGATDVISATMTSTAVAQVVADVQDRMDRRLAAAPAPAPTADRDARVITALSPRGGVGRTLVATGLAATLERRVPGEVVLVDLDLQCGDVAPLLGLTPQLSIASLSGREEGLDSADVKAILSQDSEGLHVLAAPPSLAAAVGVGPELVSALLQVLSASFRFVVIDTGPCIAETTLAALDQTTDLMLVCAPDVPSVRALGRATDALDELRILAPRRHLIVNKATDRYGMPLRDIEAVSGMSPTAQLPAAKEIAMSLNRGTPFHEAVHTRSVVAKALSSVADELGASTAQPRRGLLRRLR